MGIEDLQIHIAPKTIFSLGFLPITNTIITMWFVMAVLIILAIVARMSLKYYPTGFGNFVEWSLGGLYKFMETAGGSKDSKKHFTFFITFFLTILFCNWFGLVFGFVAEQLGFVRAPTSDLNTTLAFSIVAFLYFQYQGMKAHGILSHLGHFVNIKAVFTKGPMGLIDLFMGLLHIVSELVRPVSMSLRLFGNIFGGEVVLTVVFLLVAPIIPLPFMMLEFGVGLIQAFIFALLFLIFTNLTTAPRDH